MGKVNQVRGQLVVRQNFSKCWQVFARANHPFPEAIFLAELKTNIVASLEEDTGMLAGKEGSYTSGFDRGRRLS